MSDEEKKSSSEPKFKPREMQTSRGSYVPSENIILPERPAKPAEPASSEQNKGDNSE